MKIVKRNENRKKEQKNHQFLCYGVSSTRNNSYLAFFSLRQYLYRLKLVLQAIVIKTQGKNRPITMIQNTLRKQMFERLWTKVEQKLAPTAMIVPMTKEFIGYRVSIKLMKTRPKLPMFPIPRNIRVTMYIQYCWMSAVYNSPKTVQPIRVNEVTNLKIISFHSDVPFFYANLSTMQATPTPNPVPETIQTSRRTPTYNGVKIIRN